MPLIALRSGELPRACAGLKKWHGQHGTQGLVFSVTEDVQANRHPLMAQVRLGFVGRKQPVPPRGVEAKIQVRLPYVGGVMHPVHIRRHDEKP